MADLYGELLARTLNRGAPPGHSAAYITPQEGLQLRASGGGVPPGGGQYMANGIPSFQEAGFDDPGISNPTGPTGGLGSAGHEMGGTGWSSPAERGMAAAEHAQRQAGTEGLAHSLDDMFAAPSITGLEDAISQSAVSQNAADRSRAADIAAGRIGFETEMEAMERSMRSAPAHVQAQMSIDLIGSNPANKNEDGTFNERGVAALGRDISDGGAGYHSPAATMARNNSVTPEQAAAVNVHSDRTGGYSVNDPHSNVSVPAGMNMGLIPALAGTIAGFASPIIGVPLMLGGYPTLGKMAFDAAKKDTGMPGPIGTIATGIGQIGSGIRSGIRGVFNPITQPVRSAIEENITDPFNRAVQSARNTLQDDVFDPLGRSITTLGEDITGALPDLPGFSLGDVLSQGETPVGTFQGPQAVGAQ